MGVINFEIQDGSFLFLANPSSESVMSGGDVYFVGLWASVALSPKEK